MKISDGGTDWCGLLIDVHPDELRHCLCKTAFLNVHPNEYKPDGSRVAREVWLRVPGKHRNADAAWDALHHMRKTSLEELTINELDAVSGGAKYVPDPAPSYVVTDADRARAEAWTVYNNLLHAWGY
jgi:bacteriocin-like protein